MTHATKHAPRLAAAPAAMLAALLIAGCSTGHIGESWQCPLAEAGLCDSVAAADPAVPDPEAAGPAVLAEPLWRVRADDGAGPAPDIAPPCEAGCDAFDPFAWLARLFGGAGESAGPGDAAVAAAGPATVNPSTPADAVRESEPAASPPAPAGAETRGAAAETAALLPAPGSRPGQAPGPAPDAPDAGEVRTDEVVARIWIAPFVDADGVYREAGHVRVVLEAAGWRLK